MDRDRLIPYAGRVQSSVKHFLLEAYLERLVMITARRAFDRIAYVDAFAGPWQSSLEDLSDTSFSKAIDVMEGCRVTIARQFGRSITFRALFVERDPERFARLKRFADSRSTNQIKIDAINRDFADSTDSVANWVRADEMTFVLVDPTGWKDVIYAKTLGPLLRKRNVELLINVMWNFINLASGHESQQDNLRNLAGDEYQRLVAKGNAGGGEGLMRAYLGRLKAFASGLSGGDRARVAWFPVEFTDQDRVYYYLVYVTHHLKGMIVFLEESARALKYQQEAKFVAKQMRREVETRITDIFGDEVSLRNESSFSTEWDARSLWLKLLPAKNAELYVDEALIADMAEECGCLISRLQAALRRLIEEGVIQNLDAKKPRPKNAVNFIKGEKLRRVRNDI